MAVAHDALTFPAQFATASTQSTTHTPVGTPRGVVVQIIQTGGNEDQISGVTYGGVAMQRLHKDDTGGEFGTVYTYFLGSGIPTGAQTCAITSTGTRAKRARIATVTAATAVTAIDSAMTSPTTGSTANPSASFTTQNVGTMAYYAMWSAANAPTATPATGTTSDGTNDFGSQAGHWGRKAFTILGANSIGWTIGANAWVHRAIAIKEATAQSFSSTSEDSVAVSDAATRTQTSNRTAADVVAIADAAFAVPGQVRSTDNVIPWADAATRDIARARIAGDSVALSDVATRIVAQARAAADNVANTAAGAVTSFMDEVLADSPEIYFRLSAASGDEPNLGSASVTGSYSASVGRNVAGLINGDTDGATSFANDFGNTVSFTYNWLEGHHTLAGLAKRTDAAADYSLVGHPEGGISVQANGNVRFMVRASYGDADVTWTNVNVPVDEAFHWALEYEVGVGATLYLNGKSKGFIAATYVSPYTGGHSYTLSSSYGPGAWKGTLDEFAVFPGGLSPSRIAIHSAASKSPVPFIREMLKHAPTRYWPNASVSSIPNIGTFGADDLDLDGATANVTGPLATGDTKAFSTDGIDDVVTPGTIDLSGTNKLSMVFLMDYDEPPSRLGTENGDMPQPMSMGNPQAVGWPGVYLRANGVPSGKWVIDHYGWVVNFDAPSDGWHLWVITMDHTLTSSGMRVYLDGEEVPLTYTTNLNPAGAAFGNNQLYFGCRYGPGAYFAAKWAHPALVPAILTPDDVADLADAVGFVGGSNDEATTVMGRERATNDTVAISDVATRIRGGGARTAADAPLISDAAVRAAVARLRTAGDGVSISDVALAVMGRLRSTDNVIPWADAAVRGPISFNRTAGDGAAVSDLASRTRGGNRTGGDTIVVSDIATRAALARVRTALDVVTVADVSVRGPISPVRTAVDSVALLDAATRLLIAARTSADSWAVSDAAAGIKGTARESADSVTVSDQAVRAALARIREAVDVVVILDAAAREALTRGRSSADVVSSVDEARGVLGQVRAADDISPILDAAVRLASFQRSTQDATTITDAPTSVGGVSRTAGDSFAISDAATRTAMARARAAIDQITLIDAATRLLATQRTGQDAVNVDDDAEGQRVVLRTSNDNISISDNAIRAAVLQRIANDNVSMADAAMRTRGSARQSSDATTVSDSAFGEQVVARAVEDSVIVSDAAFRAARALGRTSADGVAVIDAAARAVVARFRTAEDMLAVEDATSVGIAGRTRTAQDTVVVSEGASKQTFLIRIANDLFAVLDVAIGEFDEADVTLTSVFIFGTWQAKPVYLREGGEWVDRIVQGV